jgi:hypothetical protein
VSSLFDATLAIRPERHTTSAGDLIGPYGVRVQSGRCDTCVFFPGNRMHLEPGRLADLVRVNRGKWLTCHQTLQIVRGYGHAAVCRGWVDAYGLGTALDELVELFGREDV